MSVKSRLVTERCKTLTITEMIDNALGLIARQKQDEIDKLQMQRTRHQENYSALRLNYNRERALTDVLAAQLQKESIT